MIQTFSTTSRKAFEVVNRYLIVRYAISGSLSSAIDILVFSFMMEISHLHYAIAAVISVTISFFARFYLQKTFAFKNRTLDVHHDLPMYIQSSILERKCFLQIESCKERYRDGDYGRDRIMQMGYLHHEGKDQNIYSRRQAARNRVSDYQIPVNDFKRLSACC